MGERILRYPILPQSEQKIIPTVLVHCIFCDTKFFVDNQKLIFTLILSLPWCQIYINNLISVKPNFCVQLN